MKEREVMKKNPAPIRGKHITLKPLTLKDFDVYYESGFQQEDPEVLRLTGTKAGVTREQLKSYVERIVNAEDRVDFLLWNEEGRLVGEAVLNEIDEEVRRANFRIALFQEKDFGKGYGSEATALTVDYGFTELHLHRIELEVFSINPRAKRAYEKAGFQLEGCLRDAEIIDGAYCDVLLMAMLEEDYERKKIKEIQAKNSVTV